MSSSDNAASFLTFISQYLSSAQVDVLFGIFIGCGVLMLIGTATVAIFAYRYIPKHWWLWWLMALLGVPTGFFGGITFSFHLYNTYTVNNVSMNLINVSKNITNASKNITNASENITNVSENITNVSENITNVSEDITNVSNNMTNVFNNITNVSKMSQIKCQTEELKCPPVGRPSPSLKCDRKPEQARTTPEGWVYVGINLGRHWDKKHFDWDSYNKRLPESDDVLTATGWVHLRERFGEHAPIVGVICPEELVQVLEIETLPNGYHWVRIKRTQKEQDSL